MQDCHSCDPGSIPGMGANLILSFLADIREQSQIGLQRLVNGSDKDEILPLGAHFLLM